MQWIFRGRLTCPQVTDYGTVCQISSALCARYGRFLRRVTVGCSALGRPLPGLVLSLPGGGAAPARVLMAAAFHGQEWLTALCALRLTEELCGALHGGLPLCGVPLEAALRERQIWLLPMVNPDGVEIARRGSKAAGGFAPMAAETGADTPGLWQANARGVDINHNFDAGWAISKEQAARQGVDRPGPRRYPGPAPESEPETKAVTALCRHQHFRHMLALHSQGEEIYWQYGEHTPPQSRLMARVMGVASGYRVTAPTGMASHSGAKDWFIESFRRPGFTLELGLGVNPLPVEKFETIYAKAREMLLLGLLL